MDIVLGKRTALLDFALYVSFPWKIYLVTTSCTHPVSDENNRAISS